jgi:hypothetical protein
MEIEEMIKMTIFIIVLVILVGGVILLLKGKGGNILDSIRGILRFGR